MPGFGGIGDAAARSVRIDQPRRALHMDEEHVDLGAGIGDFQTAAGEKSFFDRTAIRKFLDPAVATAAEDEIRVHSCRPVRVVDVDEVRGAPVEGKAELRIRPSPYLDLGFVESGDEAGPFLFRADSERNELGLEKCACGRRIGEIAARRLEGGQEVADRNAERAGLVRLHLRCMPVTAPKRSDHRRRVVRRPAGQLRKGDRLEMKSHGRPLPGQFSDSVAISFQFGSRERISRAKVHRSFTSATESASPSTSFPCLS